MKKTIFSFLFILHLSSNAFAAPGGYKLLWEDNFDGTELNNKNWNVSTEWRDAAQQSADAHSLKDGILSLRTYTKDKKHYTSFLTTKGLFETAFGYFEAKIKFHSTSGEWCAFWLQSATVGKPIGDPRNAGVEVDIVEHRAADENQKDITNMAVMNLHWDGYLKDHKNIGSSEKPLRRAPSLQDNWHTYAVLWTPEQYTFYLDEVPQWTTTKPISQIAQHVRLTCEVRANSWAGKIPTEGYGSREDSKTGMDVDWVKVWKAK